MGWFVDTTINKNEISTTELQIVAGAVVVLVASLIAYVCMKTHSKFMEAKMQKTARDEVQINRIQQV